MLIKQQKKTKKFLVCVCVEGGIIDGAGLRMVSVYCFEK
jgi:hypothetical protein